MNKKILCKLGWHFWEGFDVETDKKEYWIDPTKYPVATANNTTRRKCLQCGKEQRLVEMKNQAIGGVYWTKYYDLDEEPILNKVWKAQMWFWSYSCLMSVITGVVAFFGYGILDSIGYENLAEVPWVQLGYVIGFAIIITFTMWCIRTWQWAESD